MTETHKAALPYENPSVTDSESTRTRDTLYWFIADGKLSRIKCLPVLYIC